MYDYIAIPRKDGTIVKKDKKPMYIGKRIRHDKKKYFEREPLPWKYPKKK